MAFTPDMLPTGYNRGGDGSTNYGTAAATGQITVFGANGATTMQIEELSDSPTIERSEQQTITHRFRMAWSDYGFWISIFFRGVILYDSYGNMSKVLSAQGQHEKPDNCIFTVVSEMLGKDVPPDEFDVQDVSLNIDIIKHPRYFFALNPNSTDSNVVMNGANGTANLGITISVSDVKQAIIRAIQSYRDAPFYPSPNNINGLIQNNVFQQLQQNGYIDVNYPNPTYPVGNGSTASPQQPAPPVRWTSGTTQPSDNCPYFIISVPNTVGGLPLATAAALEIISKIWRGIDTPYIAGYQITWSSYYWINPKMSPGGYIENPYPGASGGNSNIDPVTGKTIPVAVPSLPSYLYSSVYPYDPTQTIFDSLSTLNPTCYSQTGVAGGAYAISWLRQADKSTFQRTWFKVTRTWIGSPVGHWDYDIYGQQNRPTAVTDYNSNF